MNRRYLGIVFLLLVSGGWLSWLLAPEDGKLLIAPMIGGLDSCYYKRQELAHNEPNSEFTKLCVRENDSPAAVINATLDTFSEKRKFQGDYRLGYTLYVPLFKLFTLQQDRFEINPAFAKRIAHSIRDVDRPVILYLFSDHFGVDSPFEDILAKNPENILQTTAGPLPIDKFGVVKVFPWSFVNLDNQITRLREQAMGAVLDEVCALPDRVRRRIEGVTLLGELHHMYPHFETGMGFDGDYLISDYSAVSVSGFRGFLKEKYHDVQSLNAALGSNFTQFEEIDPPSKNIRTQSLKHFWEHIDPYAHGTLPISGWVGRSSPQVVPQIHLYLNGEFHQKVPVKQGRQDVLAALPQIGSPDVGWSHDLDFGQLPLGIHQLDVFVESAQGELIRLASRKVVVVGPSQAKPMEMPMKPLPSFKSDTSGVMFSLDHPKDYASYYHNPLVNLWHTFRKSQVTAYLSHFEKLAKSKCIDSRKIYSHQILPFVNPGWDVTKQGVGQDLAVPESVKLGVSLYGEASFGSSFFEWFGQTGRSSYGVTEFHPLKSMNAVELESVFSKHKKNGAKFLSFFAEAKGLYEESKGDNGEGVVSAQSSTDFTFSKRNKSVGSSVLFESVREILK